MVAEANASAFFCIDRVRRQSISNTSYYKSNGLNGCPTILSLNHFPGLQNPEILMYISNNKDYSHDEKDVTATGNKGSTGPFRSLLLNRTCVVAHELHIW